MSIIHSSEYKFFEIHEYKSENELRFEFEKYLKYVLGPRVELFEVPFKFLDKRGKEATVPDRLGLDILNEIEDRRYHRHNDSPRIVIIEYELKKHALYSHIVAQLTKIRLFFEENIERIRKKLLEHQIYSLSGKQIDEKYLLQALSNEPTILVVIDEATEKLKKIALRHKFRILEFKTFDRVPGAEVYSEEVAPDPLAHLRIKSRKPVYDLTNEHERPIEVLHLFRPFPRNQEEYINSDNCING